MNRLLIETQQSAGLKQIRGLRHLLDKVTSNSVPHEQIRQKIRLCTSEITTNLVQHGSTANISLRFGLNKSGWWLEILDDGIAWDPTNEQKTALPNQTFSTDENGRGLALIQHQCDDIKYYPRNQQQHNRLRLLWKQPHQIKQTRILIVEDDHSLLRLYSAYLNQHFHIEVAANGFEAMDKINRGDIDLIISDIRMPHMNGLSLREHLNDNKQTRLIPFIFITSYDDRQIQNSATALGIDDYLVKPIYKEKLLQTISRVLERTRQVYQQLTDRIDQNISNALIPNLPKSSHGWRFCIANRHTGIGGGDLLLHKNHDNHLTLVLVDIMGHDDSAKFFSYAYGGYLRGLMHTIAPKQFPSQLLEHLSESALQDKLLSQVTLTACTATLSNTGQLTLASAGHPPPLHITRQGAVTLPIGGILPGLIPATRYQSKTVSVTVGERIALYTDGLFESAADITSRQQLEHKISTQLANTLNEPIEQSLAQTMKLFDKLAGSPPRDDALLLLMEPV